MATPEMRLSFVVAGENFEPKDVTALLRMTPTNCWRKGDVVPGTKMRRKECVWTVDSRAIHSWDLAAEITRFLDKLGVQPETIRAVQGSLGLSVHVAAVAYVTDQVPAISISAELMTRLLDFNASLDIDVILTESSEIPSTIA